MAFTSAGAGVVSGIISCEGLEKRKTSCQCDRLVAGRLHDCPCMTAFIRLQLARCLTPVLKGIKSMTVKDLSKDVTVWHEQP